MDVTPLVREGQQIIQSYSGSKFRISAQIYDGAVIVTPSETFRWNILKKFDELELSDIESVRDIVGDVDVLLLGCGTQMKLFSAEMRLALKQQGISVDVMDTGAACRTYNVLMAEGRRVAAAMFPA
ncbi:MAG: Mth938-like domain-containing protein [Micavibrio sp.]|nr:Mth938-like domain-containing protein [Micavibrio sp.]